jgi:hypothetical protein
LSMVIPRMVKGENNWLLMEGFRYYCCDLSNM